jgi:hypothetical protein
MRLGTGAPSRRRVDSHRDARPAAIRADVDTAIVVRDGSARVADSSELGPPADRLAHLERLAAGLP